MHFRLENDLLDKLDFENAARTTVTDPPLEFPRLISERSLESAPEALAQATRAFASSGYVPSVVVVPMPKHGFGLRPITLTAPVTRTIYQALVDHFAGVIPPSSRKTGIDALYKFGLEEERSDDSYVVDLDIAACYEYIDHQLLADELLLQSLDSSGVLALRALLTAVFPRGLGLPQAMPPSHRLADAYLQPLMRALAREGLDVHRFVDDFRIKAPDITAGHVAIEHVTQHARSLGLVLANDKVQIRQVGTVRGEQSVRDEIYEGYAVRAAQALGFTIVETVDYDNFEFIIDEDNEDEIDFATLATIVKDWSTERGKNRSALSSIGRTALSRLGPVSNRIGDKVLLDLVRHEPIRLVEVSKYIESRRELQENWSLVWALANLERTGPWAKIWLLTVASSIDEDPTRSDEFLGVLAWARECLADPSEAVRGEAAWLLARHGTLESKDLSKVFARATAVTQTGIAAVAGRVDNGGVASAIQNYSRLAKVAFEWGKLDRARATF